MRHPIISSFFTAGTKIPLQRVGLLTRATPGAIQITRGVVPSLCLCDIGVHHLRRINNAVELLFSDEPESKRSFL